MCRFKKLHQAFPKEKLKMPGKRLLGSNFDANFIENRKKGLQEFVQQIVSSPQVLAHPSVRSFLLNLPRHGRGHRREFRQPVCDLLGGCWLGDSNCCGRR